jgi:transcriptional regulator with XRE-family HTH domain
MNTNWTPMTEGLSEDSGQTNARTQLGTLLREAREKRGISADRVAYETGLKTASLLRYERGEREPGALTVATLAKLYGVCMNRLLGCSDLCHSHDEDPDRQAVLDVEVYEAIMMATTEAEIDMLLFWRPPPVLLIVGIPRRQDTLRVQDIEAVGSEVLEKIQLVAPKAYKRWASQHRNGVDQ